MPAPRIRVTVAFLGLLLAGCGGSSTTPTIDTSNVSIQNETLVPAGQACHVRGTVVNMAATKVDVGLGYQAFDVADTSIGTTRIVVRSVAPGASQDFESTGFASNSRGLIPCSAIARFERTDTSVVPR